MLGVAFAVCLFEYRKKPVLDRYGIGKIFERQRVLAHTRYSVKVRFRTQSHHKPVIRYLAAIRYNQAVLQINALHLCLKKLHAGTAPQNFSKRRDHALAANPSGSNFVHKRREKKIVLPVDKRDAKILARAHVPREFMHRVDAAEPSAK